MVSIVVHGYFDQSYCQKVVVRGDTQDPDNMQVLCDIRRYLSSQYDEGTPLVGWALQPAPSGMWLGYIEQAFNKAYAPAYLMVSFFVPRGKMLRKEALQRIEKALRQNRMWYIRNNVIQSDANWDFLGRIGMELNGLLQDFQEECPVQEALLGKSVAYCPDSIADMLENMWNPKFAYFRVIFSGKQILDNFMDIPSVGSSREMTVPPKEKYVSENQEVVREKQVGNNPDLPRKKKHKSEAHKVRKPHKSWYSRTKKNLRLLVFIGSGLILLALVTLFLLRRCSNNNQSQIDSLAIRTTNSTTFADSLQRAKEQGKGEKQEGGKYLENSPKQTPQTEEDHNETKSKNDSKSKRVVENTNGSSDSESKESLYDYKKIRIMNPSRLFAALIWDNVKDNGKKFFENYEIPNRHLEMRARNIIEKANRMGRNKFECAKKEAYIVDDEYDILCSLEMILSKN